MGSHLSFLGFRTHALPRCRPTKQPPRPSRYPRLESSSSVSTEPPVSSMTRSGALYVCFCGGHAEIRENQNTNIVKFHGLLKKSPLEQIVYYQVRLAFASAPIDLSILNAFYPLRRLASEPTSTQGSSVPGSHGSRRSWMLSSRRTPPPPLTRLPS